MINFSHFHISVYSLEPHQEPSTHLPWHPRQPLVEEDELTLSESSQKHNAKVSVHRLRSMLSTPAPLE
jgi:hypothetical protein